MEIQKLGTMLTVDIHSMRREEAKEALLDLLSNQCDGIHQVTVIHGYHSGQSLRNMVRALHHPRIERKILSMNDGETTFYLKK